jgi:hypothetical protein
MPGLSVASEWHNRRRAVEGTRRKEGEEEDVLGIILAKKVEVLLV